MNRCTFGCKRVQLYITRQVFTITCIQALQNVHAVNRTQTPQTLGISFNAFPISIQSRLSIYIRRSSFTFKFQFSSLPIRSTSAASWSRLLSASR